MKPKHACYLAGALAASLFPSVDAFYLPGAAPHDYRQGEPVYLYVNALTPMLAGYDNAKIVRTRIRSPVVSMSNSAIEIHDQL